MTKFIIICLILLIIDIQAVQLHKKHSSSKKTQRCSNPVSIINRGYNLPLYLYNIQTDDAGVVHYADIALSLTNRNFDKFCIIGDGRIQHIKTGLYVNVHGPGYFCWARDACEWASQIDGYPTQGTTWFWKDTLFQGAFHRLDALGGSMTAYADGHINLGGTSATENVYQDWIFHA